KLRPGRQEAEPGVDRLETLDVVRAVTLLDLAREHVAERLPIEGLCRHRSVEGEPAELDEPAAYPCHRVLVHLPPAHEPARPAAGDQGGGHHRHDPPAEPPD